MPTILFLCVANAARSQMAEGLARAMAPPGYRFWSAGSRPGALSPQAVDALMEDGIDISHHRPKGVDAVPLEQVDTVVTLCAEEVCPVLPGGRARRLHWPLPDPAAVQGTEADRREAFRGVKNRLKAVLPSLWEETP
ncbi:MAG: arsenate reductase ArsC [Gemmatimonadales bacterium]